MASAPVVGGGEHRAAPTALDEPRDRPGVERGPVCEHDERVRHVVSERREPAAQARRPGLRPTSSQCTSRAGVASGSSSYGTLDDDDLVDRRAGEGREHGRQKLDLLRPAVARRRPGRQHDGGDAHRTLTVARSISTVLVGCSVLGLPSIPIRSTTGRPDVTIPSTA